MTGRIIQSGFRREVDLVRAAENVHRAGWHVVDIYSPYPLHETARLLGLKRSRLPCAAFLFGVLGLGLAFWFQFWVSAWDWPINVGGRPWKSFWKSMPAFVPVAFEMMVLFAGLGVVLTWVVVCRLYPGKPAVLLSSKVTDDRFVLEVQESGPGADPEELYRLFEECHAGDWEERKAP